jgi:hypothetical protein
MKKAVIKRSLSSVLLALLLGIFLFFGWFVWAVFTDEPPQFFPLNNSQASYTIVKSSKVVQGWSEKEQTGYSNLPEPRYYVEYRGDGVFADDFNNNFFRVTVGKSKVDLEPFISKNVLITQGKFVSSSKQCIVNQCIDIYGPYVVLNIDKLEFPK